MPTVTFLSEPENAKCIVRGGGLKVRITSPASGLYLKEGDAVVFDCFVIGGTPPYTYKWLHSHISEGTPLTDLGIKTPSFTKDDWLVGTHKILLRAIDSVGTTTEDFVNFRVWPPLTASIISPNDGDTFELLDKIHFHGKYSGGRYPYSYSWTSSINGNIRNTQQFDTYDLSLGVHTIVFAVTDGFGDTSTDSISITITAPTPPKALITSPKEGDIFEHGYLITFDCLVAGGTPPYSYSWTSNIDGDIENLETFDKNDLRSGYHIITLTVTDAVGATYKTSTHIHISLPLGEFKGVCFSGSAVICDKDTLHQYLLDETVSNNWWALTDAQRKALGLKIINDFAPRLNDRGYGDCDCAGTNIDWGYHWDCSDVAKIAFMRLNHCKESRVPYESCYYWRSRHIPHTIHCYTGEAFYLPCYDVGTSAKHHVYNALQIGIDETDFDSWLFFDCTERCKILKIGDWQMPRDSTEVIYRHIDGLPDVRFYIPTSGKPTYQDI